MFFYSFFWMIVCNHNYLILFALHKFFWTLSLHFCLLFYMLYSGSRRILLPIFPDCAKVHSGRPYGKLKNHDGTADAPIMVQQLYHDGKRPLPDPLRKGEGGATQGGFEGKFA